MRITNWSDRGDMVTERSPIGVPTEWFTVEEAAWYLRVSKRTIYKWTKAGKLPAYLIGDHRYRRYRKSDLDNLPRPAEIKEHRDDTSTERGV
jgi:excisionase family DNA binding protein